MKVIQTWTFDEGTFPSTTMRIRRAEDKVFYERCDLVTGYCRKTAAFGFGIGIIVTLLVLWVFGAFK